MNVEEKSAARALGKADWPTVLPQLIRCGSRWLRSVAMLGGRGGAGMIEAQELANAAIDQLLAGERTWPRDAADDEIVNLLCQTMRSIATHAREAAHVSKRTGVDVDLQIDDASSPETIVAARHLLAGIERDIQGDAELVAYFRVVSTGEVKREKIAEKLGWSEEKVDVVKKKLARRAKSRLEDKRQEQKETLQ